MAAGADDQAHDEHETEILTDEQIDDGPPAPGVRPWKETFALADGFQTLRTGIAARWPESGLEASTFEKYADDADGLVSAISDATGLEDAAVRDALDEIASNSSRP